MAAAWSDRQGPAAEVLQVSELPAAEPGRGEVRVRLTVSGANPGGHEEAAGLAGSGSAGTWSVFQPAADVGGIAGPVPAKTCGQATVVDTGQGGQEAGRQLDPRRRAVLPWPQAEPAKPAGADPAPGRAGTVPRDLEQSRAGEEHRAGIVGGTELPVDGQAQQVAVEAAAAVQVAWPQEDPAVQNVHATISASR